MQINPHSRRQLQLQNLLFYIVLIVVMGLLAWLSTRYNHQSDWTANQRNSLSEQSVRVLEQVDGPIHITAFAREDELLRKQIRDLIARYQRSKQDVQLKFVNPDAEPERVRELGITRDGELLIAYQGRSEKVSQLAEQPLTNALQRITRQKRGKIVFLSGHGERDPKGEANFMLGNFGKVLAQKGIELDNLNLAEIPGIPDDTRLLVIASPQVNYLPGEVKIVVDYVKHGGNLLWLTEPGQLAGLDALAELLGVEFLPGVVVDATTQLFGIDNPAFALIPAYPPHAITRELDSLTLFPQAVALDVEKTDDWKATPILTTQARAWTELGELKGDIKYDADSDERAGPLDIGVALTRTIDNGNGDESDIDNPETDNEQRVVVIGDGDFLANSYLGNAGNLDLGLNLFNWLNHDDRFIAIPARSAGDTRLELGRTAQVLIGFGFLFILPAVLLASGVWIWWRRRSR